MMGLSLYQSQRLELALTGGMTGSIFPELDELIYAGTELQDALQHLAPQRTMDRYRSVMDFIYCSIHPQHERACQRFYADEGPQLREMLDPLERLEALYRMLWAMNQAYGRLQAKRRRIWGWTELVRTASLIRLPEADRIRFRQAVA